MAKVSVIVYAYNADKVLPECLDSVISQSLEEIEIICINDGSTDETVQVYQKYAETDYRFKVINQEHLGRAFSKNRGIKVATGEFVFFIKAEDKLPEKDILEKLYSKAYEYDVVICGGELAIFKTESPELSQLGIEDGYKFARDEIVFYDDYQYDYGYTRFIYNREFLINNQLYFPDYSYFESQSFLVKAMLKAGKFYAVHKVTYAKRVTYADIEWDRKKATDLLRGIVEIMDVALENGYNRLMELAYARLQENMKPVTKYFTMESLNLLVQIWGKCELMQKDFNYDDKINSVTTQCSRVSSKLEMQEKEIAYLKTKVAQLNSKIIMMSNTPSILQQIFSVRNINGHKVWTVLGFQFKFKIK